VPGSKPASDRRRLAPRLPDAPSERRVPSRFARDAPAERPPRRPVELESGGSARRARPGVPDSLRPGLDRRPLPEGPSRPRSSSLLISRCSSRHDCSIRPATKRNGPPRGVARLVRMSGGVLLSHAVSRAVPSALKGLASGFGMEPGVSPSPWPPKRYGDMSFRLAALRARHISEQARKRTTGPDRISGTAQWTRASFCSTARVEKRCGQVLGLLVPVSSMRCRTSTSGLSTQSSSWGPYPVNPVGDLILERASRLDAFSGYPFRT
jgi:hypothetical protein